MICSVLKCLKQMALEGQVALQAPQPLHKTGLTTATLRRRSSWIARYSQTCSHKPHPEQSITSTMAVTGSIFTLPVKKGVVARDAAPWAWEIVSPTSFGP